MNKYDIDNIKVEDLTKEQLLGKIKYFEISLEIKNLDDNLRNYREASLPLLKKQLNKIGGDSWIKKN